MAYNANIPQPTDQLSQSQADILGNFQSLASVVISNNGAVTFPNQAIAPIFPANQDGLYAFTNALTTLSELYISKNIQGGGTSQIPLTASSLSTVAPANNQAGWAYLPTGHLIKWGLTGAVTANILLQPTIPNGTGATGPAFNKLFFVLLTPVSGAALGGEIATDAGIIGANQFQILSTTGCSNGVFFLAIGY